MSEKVSSVKAIVEACLGKLVKSYEGTEHIEDFLTESDVASSLFCMLRDEMKKGIVEGFRIHGGLRTCKEGKGINLVLTAKDSSSLEWEWKKPEAKNSGAVVDIVIVNSKQKYFRRAEEISPKKYWRLVTFPLKAFAVCIEVKIRISGNIKRIKKDIKKLCKIRETNKNCLVYLVVVDRKASNVSIENIRKFCDENGVPLHIAVPSYQT